MLTAVTQFYYKYVDFGVSLLDLFLPFWYDGYGSIYILILVAVAKNII